MVKFRYRRLALKWHPKLCKEDLNTCYRNFCRVSEAYEVLHDSKQTILTQRKRKPFTISMASINSNKASMTKVTGRAATAFLAIPKTSSKSSLAQRTHMIHSSTRNPIRRHGACSAPSIHTLKWNH
jgi:curved DNA-binding protein CbpA